MSAASTADRAVPAAGEVSAIVVGLGNPMLGDDGAGWVVADAVERALGAERGVRVERLAVGGLTLMEHLLDHRHAIVVDAVLTGDDPPGTVRRIGLDGLPGREASHVDSAHDASLASALEAASALGATVPETIDLVTIEAVSVLDLGETLSPPVADAVPAAVDVVLRLLVR